MISVAVWLLLYAASADALFHECVTSTNGENYFKYTGSGYKTVNSQEDSSCKEIPGAEQFYFIINNYNTDGNSCNEMCTSKVVKVHCTSEPIEDEIFFPKCCPPNYVYDPDEYKCLSSNITHSDEIVDSVLLIKSGLQKCKVIADYIFYNFDELAIAPNRSVSFQNKVYSQGNYCIDDVVDSESFVLRTCHSMDFCRNSGTRCIKKCCPDGQIYSGSECGSVIGHGLPLKKFNDSIRDVQDKFAIITNESCRKYPASQDTFDFFVEKNGSFLIDELDRIREYRVDESYYCIEHIEIQNFSMDTFLLCMLKNDQPVVRYKVTRIVLLISAICLVLTIAGYLLLQELRNTIGKLIVCYCSSLLLTFVFLTWLQFFPYGYDYCIVAGYIITFATLATFTWMNIISYDIWSAIGSMKIQLGNQKQKERKKFILYNIYGWSLPTVITSFAVIDNQLTILPDNLHAYIGKLQCMIEKYLDGNYGYHFFITIPCAFLLTSNLVIFIKTVRYILKVKDEINRMKDLDECLSRRKILKRDKERILMVLRIFIITGISWLFEIISLFLDFKQNPTLSVIETIFDVFNCLQGVFIFCIFMLKEKVIYAVAKRFGIRFKNESPRNTSTAETILKSPSSPDMMLRKSH